MISIKNMHNEKPKEPWDFRVDRKSPLGNPYRMIGETDRIPVCSLYEKHFKENLSNEAKEYLKTLADAWIKYGKLNLFCWCTPKHCHAETIKTYISKGGK